jgi:hypothetical protein
MCASSPAEENDRQRTDAALVRTHLPQPTFPRKNKGAQRSRADCTPLFLTCAIHVWGCQQIPRGNHRASKTAMRAIPTGTSDAQHMREVRMNGATILAPVPSCASPARARGFVRGSQRGLPAQAPHDARRGKLKSERVGIRCKLVVFYRVKLRISTESFTRRNLAIVSHAARSAPRGHLGRARRTRTGAVPRRSRSCRP